LTVVAIMIAVYSAEGPLSIADFDRRQIKTLLSYGGWVTVSSLMSPILSEFDQFVIGSLLGVAAITHYIVPMNLVMRSQILAAALSRTLFPRMSSLARDDAHSLASRALVSLAYGYAAVCAPAIIVTPVFFRYWISADFSAVASPVAEILFFGAWINGLAFVPFGLLQSQGRPDVTGKFHAAELLPFVAVLWAMTSTYGIVGAAIAWSLRCAIDALCLFWAPGIPARTLLRALPLPLLLLAASAAAANAIGPNLWPAIGAAIVAEVAAIALALVMAHDLKTLARTTARRGLRAIGLARADLPARAN
jgi:O-antigen/teichoic acid export membrane protein